MNTQTQSLIPRKSPKLTAALRGEGFVGRVIEPADEDYDAARACWNGAVDRRPAAIARASDAEDVAAAIRAARAAEMPLTVRGGGHSVSGRSLRDGALCIDLRALNRVRVEPASRSVRVGGGALLSELDAATQRHGLAVPGGQISHTGVGGLTLGGGVGWLMRHHGLTIDSLRAAHAVLSDGQRVRASEEEHPDLFWALRGGGGDFAVVSEFEFQGRRVGPTVLGGMLIHPWERAGAAIRSAREVMETAPDELTVFVALITAPPQDPFPRELWGRKAVAVAAAWSGELAAGERVLAPLRSAVRPLVDLIGPMPYTALQSMLDPTAPPGFAYYDRQHYLDRVGDDFVAALLTGFERVPTPQSHVMIGWLGGAVDRVPAGATAFGHRSARAMAWIIGCSGSEPLPPTADWVRELWDDTSAFAAGGAYLNALNRERPTRDAFAADVWERLLAVKRRYDPEGVLDAHGIR
ncbi:MAG: FAD-binding oxidoreductase [Syntrophothermus sp.]